MDILFISDANGHEHADPYATLVHIDTKMPEQVFIPRLYKLETTQLAPNRRGGSYREIMQDLAALGINSVEVRSGRRSDFIDEPGRNWTEYKLISGNY